MIGEKVIIRTRMSTADAHYAGDLVNGSKILDFFGDVATELLIRLDGDEGLFRAYEQVDFLAPIYAGDFMEYHGWIEEVGNSSRKAKFEAYKVIQLVNDPGMSESAAEVLEEPILCGTATGVMVVKKELQRGAQDPAFQR
ncbi:hotdog fold domain-containing protein [Anoxynatronum buryatiense]|uniref:3-aminobutyryl-CoA ammonia-lyase n=1 Tax=Anoxynatronum buryatiense TaxID=489973 RepID=A0AA45WV34_9CLOT|nr:hotdog fold domain-containing protein [Anoxynatronum buryatiense]SMP51727.1 3-aminobutyryl-CoA ammonia-lyase [Anoxynatronum buryatiense]